MQDRYLEATFRHGRPLAAYFHLPRAGERKSARSRRVECGLVIDYARSGRAIGIEITAPSQLSVDVFNAVLRELGEGPVCEADFAPLHAA